MPTKIANNWTLSLLLQMTHEVAPSRFQYFERDVIKSSIKIKKITVYEGKSPGAGRTKYICTTDSYPQYYPYYTKKDSRGRERKYQRSVRHSYDTTLQLDTLSMNSPFKMRLGSEKKYEFNVDKNLIKSKKNPNGRYLSVGDYNIVQNGINPDFFFTQSFVRYSEGCLFGKNWAEWAPDQTRNRFLVPFALKHEIWVLETLMNRGILSIK